MNKNTQYTKKRLTILFAFIVFLIVFTVSSIFSIVKFVSINHIVTSDYEFLTNSINEKNLNGDEFLTKFIASNKRKKNNRLPLILNYILLDGNNKTISKLIITDFSDIEIENIINNKSNEIHLLNNSLVKTINLKNGFYGIIIGEKDYVLSDLLLEILIYFLISIFSSLFIYFLFKKHINKLFIPVEKSIVNMNDFIHNAGHELQTPLSTIVSNVDFYNKMKEKNPEILGEIKEESLRMGNLINTLLKLSGEENGLDSEVVLVGDFLEKITTQFDVLLKEKNIIIEFIIDGNSKINVNKYHLNICLSNIISNSIKYSNKNSKIQIIYNSGLFKIKDNGIGILNENIDKIFDRFYKEDKSRNTKGFGIGLSLVKKLCDINLWEIKVESIKGEGSTFIIKL